MSIIGIVCAIFAAYFFGFATAAMLRINPYQGEEEASKDESHAATRYRVSQSESDKGSAGSSDA